MASQTTNYQCPRCTGPMHFDGTTGKVRCEYCESIFTVEEIEELFQAKNDEAEQAKPPVWDTDDAGNDWGADGVHMRTYQCTSCGAELDCEETTAATQCPYCGNPTVIPSQLSGGRKPDYVIPFKVDRKQAMAALRKHYGGKKLLPKLFSEDNRLEKIQGVYVPFWLYDGEADCAMTYAGERVNVFRTGDREITEISDFRMYREGSIRFQHLPVDASVKMDDDLMDSLEPYDMSELKPFSMSYLPGYLADHFDVEKEDCALRADERAKNTARDVLYNSTTGFTNVRELARNIQLVPEGAHCALLPVWMLTTRWNDKTYTFAMNGQTGKLVGDDLPVDQKASLRMRLVYGGIFAVVLYLIKWLMMLV